MTEQEVAFRAWQGGVAATSQSEGILESARCLISKTVHLLQLLPGRDIANDVECPSIDHFLCLYVLSGDDASEVLNINLPHWLSV